MKVLVTGAKGFVGKNLCSQLNNIREGKARWYEGVQVDEVFEYDLGNTQEELDRFCAEADFVFQPCRYQPSTESGRVHARQFRFCRRPA